MVGHESLLQRLRECPLGTREIVGEVTPGKHRRILLRCRVCGQTKNVGVDSILRGSSQGCRCQVNRKYGPVATVAVKRLGQRYDAIYQRCTNPKNESWSNYGGRGIQLRFQSREAFIPWCLKYLPHPNYKGVDIDRTRNEGHYEPGNLRLAPRRLNLANKRTNRMVTYKGRQVCAQHLWHLLKTDHPDFPFQWAYTARLAARLGSGEAVLAYRKQNRRVPKDQRRPDPAVLELYGYTTS